jgi:hypothetical protein
MTHFEGSCPFLTCTERGPHLHEACESCGALRHGNFNCLTCMRWQCRLTGSRLKDGSVSLLRIRVKMLARGLW